MTVLEAIIIGLVHGFTEIFPVSASGHISLIENLFGIPITSGGHLLFDILMHLGTLVSVCVIYWQDLTEMVYELLGVMNLGPYAGMKKEHNFAARELIMILFAILPMIFIIPVRKYLMELYQHTALVGVMIILSGFVIFTAERMTPGKRGGKSISILDSVIIGICQTVSSIPGISRTGVTLTAGYASGLSRSYALRFALLLYIPTTLGYCLFDLIELFGTTVDPHCIPAYLVGTAVSILAGIAAIISIRKLLEKEKLGVFSYYSWVVGALAIILTIIF